MNTRNHVGRIQIMNNITISMYVCFAFGFLLSGCENPGDQSILQIISECQNVLGRKDTGKCKMSDSIRESLGDPENILPVNQIESLLNSWWDKPSSVSTMEEMFRDYQAMVPTNSCQAWNTCAHFLSLDVWLYKLTDGPEILIQGGLIPIPERTGGQCVFWFLVDRDMALSCGRFSRPISNQ
jgi:hypothetical protein